MQYTGSNIESWYRCQLFAGKGGAVLAVGWGTTFALAIGDALRARATSKKIVIVSDIIPNY